MLLGELRGSMGLLEAIGRPVAQSRADMARPGFPWNGPARQGWDYQFH